MSHLILAVGAGVVGAIGYCAYKSKSENAVSSADVSKTEVATVKDNIPKPPIVASPMSGPVIVRSKTTTPVFKFVAEGAVNDAYTQSMVPQTNRFQKL